MKPLSTLGDLLAGLPLQDGIVVHSGAAHPTALARHLAESAGALRGRPVYTLMPLGAVPYAQPPARDGLQLRTFLPGAGLRDAMHAGRVEALRQPLSAIPGLFARREYPVGAVLARVSPPDPDGRVCLGVSVDFMRAAVEAARFVVAEIDPQMPRMAGDCWIDVRRIDAFVPAQDGPHPADSPVADAAEEAIAGHIAGLVEDGAVLQLGVGALPDQVLARLSHLRHLGLHSGIIGAGARQLIERGVIDNSRKAVLAGVSVATMALGPAGFYAFLDRNEAIEMHPCSFTHSREVLLALGNLHAINTALQVDLQGAVNAEWAGERRVALPGGLGDFARAASSSAAGRSIMALRSLDRAGRSNIVASLPPGRAQSLAPGEVDFFVTEWGVASVRGMPPGQRRQALASIAHPQHREALERA